MRAHLAALFIAIACSGHESAGSKESPRAAAAPPQATPSQDSSSAATPHPSDTLRTLYQQLVGTSQSRVAFRSRLGEPRRITAEAEPNIHDATATDTVVQWAYDRFRLVFLVVAGRDLLVEARAGPDDPAIGTLIRSFGTLAAADSTLGAPGSTSIVGDTMVYHYDISEPDIGVSGDAINLYFVNGRLVSVAAVPYVD